MLQPGAQASRRFGITTLAAPDHRFHQVPGWDTHLARGSQGGPITLRLGVLGDGVDDTIDLLAHDLDEGLLSAGAGSGMIRWTGDAPIERLRAVRRAAAAREIPMTLERAPWPVRRAFGHFGAYREGIGQIVGRLRDTFDPGQCLQVALEGVKGGER